jgi:LysM repeat protein
VENFVNKEFDMRISLAIVILAVCFIISVASSGVAEQYEYKDYEVKKGDTLWDISSKELEDPFQWPLIWKENIFIENPDRIYPGQGIRIPLRVIMQKEEAVPVKPEPEPIEVLKPPVKVIEPVRGRYLITKEALLAGGYITRDVPYKGEIIGSPRRRIVFGKGDEIFFNSIVPVNKGDRFYVIRKVDKVEHPKTREDLGYLVGVVGIVEAEEAGKDNVKARVIEAFNVIYTGDFLDEYYEVEPPFLPGEPRKPQIEGFVVAMAYMKTLSSQFELVHIDKGRADGLQVGDVLMTLIPGTENRQNGLLQIVSLRDNTALALVVKSDIEINRGDAVSGLQ